MGSAQSRRQGYVLQHGSLPLVGDITRLIDVLALPADRAESLRCQLAERACTLAQALGVDEGASVLCYENVAQALAAGFVDTLNLDLEPGQPTPFELRQAGRLIRERFANPTWTYRR
jgi:lipoyl(octanoyl) transferase